jgi:hypothetical protein
MNALPRRPWTGPTVVVALLLLAACGGTGGTAGTGGATGSEPGDAGTPKPDVVAIRVVHSGGFVPVTAIPSRLPLISVYGDGWVISEGPVPAIYPGPALPNIQRRQIPVQDVRTFVQKALDAGVGSGADLGRPTVTDMPDTVFTVTTDDGVKQLEVYALEMTEDGPNAGLTPEQRAARQKLTAFLAELQELQAAGGSEPYPATSVAAIATAYPEENPPTEPSPPPAVAWPGPALPGEKIGGSDQVGCVTVTGDEAKAVLAAAESAKSTTPWTSGGKTWSLQLRPLLPDESGCADLATQR